MEYNNSSIEKLKKSISHNRKLLQPYRENRVAAVREFVGRNYSDSGSKDRVPINMLELFVSTYSRQLIGNRPNVFVQPRVESLAPQAKELELATNHVLKEMEIESTLRAAVIDALFCIGIVKVGVAEADGEAMRGFRHDSGQPFAETIDLDDWVHDMSARHLDECSFMGHRFKVPTEVLRSSDVYSSPENIPTSKRSLINDFGDMRVNAVGHAEMYADSGQSDISELWEVYLPREGRVCTFIADETGLPLKKIRDIEWEGPEMGPYHFLKFSEVPGNTMPLPPVATMMDLHDLANKLFRKLGRQAERQKDVVGYRGSAEQDAKNVQSSFDGGVIRMDDPQSVQTYKFGGIDQQNLAFVLQLKNFFNYYGGNIDTLGGLGPQSSTVGQDKLINESASQRMADMQEAARGFAKSLCTSVGWHIYHDNESELELEKTVAGTTLKVPFVYDKSRKESDIFDFNMDIEPHSIISQTPGEKLQQLRELMNSFISPLLPAMQQQGISVDGKKLIELVSRYSQIPELAGLFKGVQQQAGGGQEQQSPAQKQTEIVRTNRPGATTRGQDDAMARMMMAAGDGPGVQPAEAAAIERPVG